MSVQHTRAQSPERSTRIADELGYRHRQANDVDIRSDADPKRMHKTAVSWSSHRLHCLWGNSFLREDFPAKVRAVQGATSGRGRDAPAMLILQHKASHLDCHHHGVTLPVHLHDLALREPQLRAHPGLLIGSMEVQVLTIGQLCSSKLTVLRMAKPLSMLSSLFWLTSRHAQSSKQSLKRFRKLIRLMIDSHL